MINAEALENLTQRLNAEALENLTQRLNAEALENLTQRLNAEAQRRRDAENAIPGLNLSILQIL
jgi:hypothetical protein